jgi:hypothetical protein
MTATGTITSPMSPLTRIPSSCRIAIAWPKSRNVSLLAEWARMTISKLAPVPL